VKCSGDIAEIKFHLAAHERGMHLSKPLKALHYDFVLDTGKRLLRIQVKSTGYQDIHGAYRLNVRRTVKRGAAKKAYEPGSLDIIVAYVHGEDAWYIIPFSAIRVAHLALYPHRPGSIGSLERYRDAWNLLES
jgi:hypothetical protein